MPPLLPTLDAALNAVATFCLLRGFVAMRAEDHARHGRWMARALVASALFLCVYLVHHFAGDPREFRGEGLLRVAYLTMLATHVVLAALVVPLVLVTFARGRRHDRERHVRIARVAFPVWLYVSVTGILVYVVLYLWDPGPAL